MNKAVITSTECVPNTVNDTQICGHHISGCHSLWAYRWRNENGHGEKMEQKERAQQRRLRISHLRRRRTNQEECWYQKPQQEERGFQQGHMLLRGQGHRLRRSHWLSGGHGWHEEHCVRVEEQTGSNYGELRMRERWGRSTYEYKPLLSNLWMWKMNMWGAGRQEGGLWEAGLSWRVVRSGEIWVFQGQRELSIREVRLKTPLKGR